MASDFRNAPDDTVIDPDRCGHGISVGSTAIECDLGPEPHDRHRAERPVALRRPPIGSTDHQAGVAVIEWVDERPAATVGDMRAIIRRMEEGRHV